MADTLGLSGANLSALIGDDDTFVQPNTKQWHERERLLRGKALRAPARSAPAAPMWYTLAIEAMEATGHFLLDGRDGVPRSAELPTCTWPLLKLGYCGALHSLSVCHLGLAALDGNVGALGALIAIDVRGQQPATLPRGARAVWAIAAPRCEPQPACRRAIERMEPRRAPPLDISSQCDQVHRSSRVHTMRDDLISDGSLTTSFRRYQRVLLSSRRSNSSM